MDSSISGHLKYFKNGSEWCKIIRKILPYWSPGAPIPTPPGSHWSLYLLVPLELDRCSQSLPTNVTRCSSHMSLLRGTRKYRNLQDPGNTGTRSARNQLYEKKNKWFQHQEKKKKKKVKTSRSLIHAIKRGNGDPKQPLVWRVSNLRGVLSHIWLRTCRFSTCPSLWVSL